MSNGGSSKPADIKPGEEAKIILRVPAVIDLSDNTKVTVRTLNLREIFQHAPSFLVAVSGLIGEKEKADATDEEKSKGGFLFMGKLLSASWEPTVEMLVLVTDRSAEQYEVMDPADMLKIIRIFIRRHKRVAETFFAVLEEAGFPVSALRTWLDSFKTLMSSLAEDTASKK